MVCEGHSTLLNFTFFASLLWPTFATSFPSLASRSFIEAGSSAQTFASGAPLFSASVPSGVRL